MISHIVHTMHSLEPGTQVFVTQRNRGAVRSFTAQFGTTPALPLRLATHDWEAPLEYPERIVLLCRSPLDALVSYYHYVTGHRQSFSGTLDDFLAKPGLGVPRLARWYNAWGGKREQSLIVRYRDLRSDTKCVLESVLKELDVSFDVDLGTVVDRWDFNSSQAREISSTGKTDTSMLFVRRGWIGEGTESMTPRQREYVSSTLDSHLDPHGRALLTSLNYVWDYKS